MDYLPIFTKLSDKHCLMVGGGNVAERKLSLLIEAGAQVTLVAPSINESIRELIKNDSQISLSLIEDDYNSNLMDGMDLVIAATDDQDRKAESTILLDDPIADQARLAELLVSVLDVRGVDDLSILEASRLLPAGSGL